nr:MAG TPA: hypothetical protein [Caudoviricetes sp.]
MNIWGRLARPFYFLPLPINNYSFKVDLFFMILYLTS